MGILKPLFRGMVGAEICVLYLRGLLGDGQGATRWLDWAATALVVLIALLALRF